MLNPLKTLKRKERATEAFLLRKLGLRVICNEPEKIGLEFRFYKLLQSVLPQSVIEFLLLSEVESEEKRLKKKETYNV